MKKNIKNQENAIKEIIRKYGPVIDLRKSPYLIVEISRQFGHIFAGGGTVASGTPGSHGTPPPPPGPHGMPSFDRIISELFIELRDLKKAVLEMSARMK